MLVILYVCLFLTATILLLRAFNSRKGHFVGLEAILKSCYKQIAVAIYFWSLSLGKPLGNKCTILQEQDLFPVVLQLFHPNLDII